MNEFEVARARRKSAQVTVFVLALVTAGIGFYAALLMIYGQFHLATLVLVVALFQWVVGPRLVRLAATLSWPALLGALALYVAIAIALTATLFVVLRIPLSNA